MGYGALLLPHIDRPSFLFCFCVVPVGTVGPEGSVSTVYDSFFLLDMVQNFGLFPLALRGNLLVFTQSTIHKSEACSSCEVMIRVCSEFLRRLQTCVLLDLIAVGHNPGMKSSFSRAGYIRFIHCWGNACQTRHPRFCRSRFQHLRTKY